MGASVTTVVGRDAEVPVSLNTVIDQQKERVALDAAMGLLADADLLICDGHGPAISNGRCELWSAHEQSSHAVVLHLEQIEAEHAACWTPPGPAGVSALSGASIAIGKPDLAPLSLPAGLVASVHAVNGAAAALAGLYGNLRAGRTFAEVRVSAAGCLEYFVGINGKMYDGYPRQWMREGRRAAGSSGPYPAAIFPASDGYVLLLARSTEDWHGILAAMGNPAWAQTETFRDPLLVSELCADEADVHVSAWTRTKTSSELSALADKHGFAAARVRTLAEALTEPQLQVRSFLHTVSVAGRQVRVPGLPFRVSHAGPAQAAAGRRPAAQVSSAGPLAGLRVLDLSWVWSGPMTAMTLADLGADVIKIESSRRPDGSRLRGRPRRNGVPVAGPALEVTPYFHQLNHGKRSLELDLTNADHLALVMRLARSSDVIVENMRPGVLARLGLTYAALAGANPGLILLSLSLAGQTGPLSKAKGYAGVMSALSGLDSCLGYDSELTGMLSVAIGDPNAASYALASLSAALMLRHRTGRGCWLDLSQLEALMFSLTPEIVDAAIGGTDEPDHSWSGTVRCADGRWLAARIGDSAWQVLQDADGPGDPAQLTTWAERTTCHEAAERLQSAGAELALVRTLAEVRASAHRRTLTIGHPFGGPEQIWTAPWWFDGSLCQSDRRAPLLGEDTSAIREALQDASLDWPVS
jgi:crotonobetainyl-CoA:carnitine CoA-transferase CaiB-like acyl-CoA transferase